MMEAIFVNGVRSYTLCHMGNYFNISLCSTRRFHRTYQTKDKSLSYLYLQLLRLSPTIVNVRLIYTRPMKKRQVDYSKAKTRNKRTQGIGPTYTIITYRVIMSLIWMMKRKSMFSENDHTFLQSGDVAVVSFRLGTHIPSHIFRINIHVFKMKYTVLQSGSLSKKLLINNRIWGVLSIKYQKQINSRHGLCPIKLITYLILAMTVNL